MADDPDPSAPPLQAPLVPPDDPIFDFDVTIWLDPPAYVTNLPETTPESNIRLLAEQEYHKSTTPTSWHRYLTLGRYVVDGFTFDTIMEEGHSDPLKMHCLIWFQYAYHLDHNIDIPPKLQAWAATRSQPYLAQHAESVFLLDTKITNWKEFSRTQSLSNPWSEVTNKQRKPKNKVLSSPKLYVKAASLVGTRSKPVTIVEETSKTSTLTETRGQKRSANHDESSAASDGKQSVLIPTLNVPVCDGTHRVTIRWKTSVDMVTKLLRNTQEMKEEIYNLLNDIFDDDDGLLYKWQHSGTDQHNSISKMTPDEVRQYLCPSIGILPSKSMLVIPLRFGFSSSTPSKWRNRASTQDNLTKHEVTVSFSNCTSISGKLVVAGYILLKAPMTTHRLRYLQSLRKTLPPTTPPFDILLHKRTPSDQQIPHLAVQCGNTQVHSLSEALANILTGNGSALYIPRFAFSQMTDDQANALFQTHDAHVKSLRWLPLSPLLSNLDRPRTEYQPDGSVLERTTREWARSIKNLEGNALAQCDVVNGGMDQLSYLLFTPQHTEAATNALEEYRKRLYPFSQREAKFRESVGPPLFIHLSKSVIANLEFIKRLSSTTNSSGSAPSPNASDSDNSTAATPDSGMTESTVGQATRPMTPAESLRQRYNQRSRHSDATEPSEDESTAASTATASKMSDGRMSTSSAKLRELDAVIQRHKLTNEKKDAKNSECISLIERQLHRINDLDSKLDDVKTDFGQRLNLFETRMVDTVKDHIESSNNNMENMNISMEKLMSVVNKLVQSGTARANSQEIFDARKVQDTSTAVARLQSNDGALSGSTSNSSSSRSSMSTESIAAIQSPEHKRRKSGKKSTKESVRRQLHLALEAATRHSSPTPTIDQQASFDSLDCAMRQMDEIVQADINKHTSSLHPTPTPDPESQYTASLISHTENDTNAPPSLGRNFRQNCIDPSPSVSYGDPIIQKTTGSIRLFFQNVKGLTYTTTKEDYNYYLKCIQGLEVDVIGLSETNTCWSHHHISSDFRFTLRRYVRQNKTVFGAVSPDIDKCLPTETFQSGGNLTSILGSLASRVGGPDILDGTGLRRWCGTTMEGQDGRKLPIVTAYRVCSGSPQTSPIGSSFLREYEFFRERQHTSVNPRRLFLADLQKTILGLQEAGHCTILMLDANSTLDDPQLLDFLAQCGLHDLHANDPAPSTFIGSANRRILDYIFGCGESCRYVLRSGTLAYTEGPQSDHRSLYVDLSPEFITTPSWHSITTSTSRDLHTGNPEKVLAYHSAMLKYYTQHHMVERIQRLYDIRDTMDRESLRLELIKWDNDQGRAMELSERILRRPPQKCAWSPLIRNAAILRRYWLLWLRELLRNENYSSTFRRWQHEVQNCDPTFSLPFLDQCLPIEQIRLYLNGSNRRFRSLQKKSIPLRLRTYQELLETYLDDAHPDTKAESQRKAKILQNTIAGESLRQTFDNLCHTIRPSEHSSLSKVLVPTNTSLASESHSSYNITQNTPIDSILWETIVDREEIDRHLLQYNRDSFRAASESPCGHGIIHDALSFSSLSEDSEALLAGIVPAEWCGNDNYLREFLASFVIPTHVHAQGDIDTEISAEDVLRGFKGWKESTSTSPSGRHLGHYKAVIQHPILLQCFVQFMNIVVHRGIAIPRWCHATNVMIEKDAGQPRIHRLRIIHLFEADYNFFLKLQWGHRLVRHAVSLNLLHDSQHGSIPRRTAMDPIMLTQLTSDLCRILKHDLARFDNDASACYDRIIVALGMLAARRCGMPRNAIRLHAEALQFMKYTVKTMYGISETNYHGTVFAPLFGTGQGSGASPAVWLTLVVLLLHSFDRLIPHRMNFVPISGARKHSRSSDAFVDDTSVGFTSCDDTSYSALISRLQEVAQTWEKLLFFSGGKLNLNKCSWYILRWEWKNGRPFIQKIHPDDPKIALTQGAASTQIPIKRHTLTQSSRMLGVYLNPMGDFTDHLNILKKKADDFSRRILSPKLTEADVAIFHRSIYIPSMRYSLAAVAADEESLGFVQTRVIKSILQKLHISSTIPTSIRHGPPDLGGLGLYDLRTEAGIEAIKFLRNSLYSDSEAGNLIRLNLQHSQREAGVGFYLLEKPQVFISYLTPSWILSIRQFLANNNMSVTVSDIHMDRLRGKTDDYIMHADHLKRYSPSQQSDLNLVRLWLQVTTLSDMSDPDRVNRILPTYLDAKRPLSFVPSATWPRQSQPTKAQTRLWKRYITSSFLRYIPFWRIPPVPSTPVESDAPIEPTQLSDFAAYRSKCLSRTERRLLDGLEQVASDIKIWRAFRSKQRLHLASDGGLGDNLATFGWVLSSGKEVLFQCSGPVDGPIDTNSSTRSELGGCASSLLFLTSLSTFWGIRHRCAFRWYTDSTSAISRFNKFCGRGRRSSRMPSDSDILSIITSCRRQLRRPFTPHWVRAHQDDSTAYDKLPLAARLNIDADFLATRYRQHGRLRAIALIEHRVDQQVSVYINGVPVTGQYDDCVRFHINGYHHRNFVQHSNGWDNRTWEDIDFFTFGTHFKRLKPSHRGQHFKFVHDYLPLGERRYREAPIPEASLKLCPCCRKEDETPLHFVRCQSNKAFQSSMATMRTDILTSDTHPARYLLCDGVCHALQFDTPYSPTISQYPRHFQEMISTALESQLSIGWHQALKGYFTKEWGSMAQVDMHKGTRNSRQGETRMRQIIRALSAHTRRLWLSRNESLHSPNDATSDSIRSAETAEIKYYHSRPHLLRTGDQHYCSRSLPKLLAGTPATRRRWLRKVKQSTADLTKDGTRQTLLTNYFRIK